MRELINREDAIKITWVEPQYSDPINVLAEVRDRIKALPTVDAVPVRHGKWIYTTLKRYKEYTVTCPFCGAKYHDCYDGYIDVDDFNYCPNCGAKMDGADGERL